MSNILGEGKRTPEIEAALSALSLLLAKEGGADLVHRAYGEAIRTTQLGDFKRHWKATESDEFPCLHTVIGKKHPKGVLDYTCELPLHDHTSAWQTEEHGLVLVTQPYGPIYRDDMARLLAVAAKWRVQLKIEAGSWWFPGRCFLIIAHKASWEDIAAGAVAKMSGTEVEPIEEDPSIVKQFNFLERDLQGFLSRNLHFIEPGLRQHPELELEQHQTGVGYIDLLCQDSQDRLVVVELKAGAARDSAIGQITGYMSWVQDNLAKGSKVRGIIVCMNPTDRILAAAKLIPELSIKRFKLSFSIESAV